MKFNNSFELATYFVEKCSDDRRWGELRDFSNSASWRYYFYDMGDKYVRGKSLITPFITPEYQKAKYTMMSNFIDYIDKRLTFPLEYNCRYIDCGDAHFADFEVTYTPIDQLSFDMTII